MKRFIQFVAVALLALIAVQPVMAASSCLESLHRHGECLDTCCAMHDHHMSTPGHMTCMPGTDSLAASGCGHAGCFVSAPIAPQGVKSSSMESAEAMRFACAVPEQIAPQSTSTARAVFNVETHTAPRRILLQTFRI